MSLLRHLRNAVSGRARYWDRTDNSVVSKLWNKLEDLENPNKTIFQHFIVSAGIVIKELIGMGKMKQTIINVDCRKIDIERLCQLYVIMLCYFSFLFNTVNKSLKESVEKELVKLTDSPELVQRIFRELGKHYSKSMAELNIGSLGGRIWDEIVRITKSDATNPKQFIYFITISSELYKEAMQSIKMELDI